MNSLPSSEPPAPPSLGVNDILFVIFRHKWKIIACGLLGIAASAGIWLSKKQQFESSARILVKYVSDTKSALDAGQGNIQSPDSRGNHVLNSEIAILTSGDSIIAAARTVTPQRILTAFEGGTNLNRAAAIIARNFEVQFSKNSSVLELSFRHPDAQVSQDVLQQLIRNYQRRHLEVHRAGAAYDELQQQTELIRTRLLQTEAELRRQKAAAGVVDLDQAKKDFADQISTLRKAVFDTEASLAERRVQAGARNIPGFRAMDARTSNAPTNLDANSSASAHVAVPPDVISTNGILAVAASLSTPSTPSAQDFARYEVLSQKLAALKAKELDLVLQYREGSKMVQQHRQQISEVEESLKSLGIDPAIVAPHAVPNTASPVRLPAFDSEGAVASIRGLEARLQSLTNQLARVRLESQRIEESEDLIAQTERRKNLEEAQFTYYSKSLEQARLDQTLDATKLNNISILQEPSNGVPTADKKVVKMAGGVLAGGFALGFGLAFLLDLILDHSVKRRKDLEAGLQLPVFATIPSFGRNGHSRLKPESADVSLQIAGETWMNGEIPPWEESDPMLPYYEALRDRVVMSYGDDPHKPKIVGVTSCDERAGVTRLATGLAASLSRDVDRSVLFIGLSKGKVAVSAFAKGRPTDALTGGRDRDAIEESGRNTVLEKNLYSLATTGRNLAGASIVQSFSDLMPRLKVSEYDFIIFDLPPITQTSGSIRLASQMERTLLVVEAEKTSKDKIKQAKSHLARTKTQLAAVLNHSRTYGPKSLNPDA